MTVEAKKTATKAQYRVERVCPECGTAFGAGHVRQIFCSPAHNTAFHNREKTRFTAISYAMAWRRQRGSGDVAKFAMAEMCRLLDQFNAEDLAAGRPGAVPYIERRMKLGFTGAI